MVLSSESKRLQHYRLVFKKKCEHTQLCVTLGQGDVTSRRGSKRVKDGLKTEQQPAVY